MLNDSNPIDLCSSSVILVLMEIPYEYGTQQDKQNLRQWAVEYVVEHLGERFHHITVLEGTDVNEVQHSLFEELRELYPAAERLEVAIVRMDPIQTQTEERLFSDCTGYNP